MLPKASFPFPFLSLATVFPLCVLCGVRQRRGHGSEGIVGGGSGSRLCTGSFSHPGEHQGSVWRETGGGCQGADPTSLLHRVQRRIPPHRWGEYLQCIQYMPVTVSTALRVGCNMMCYHGGHEGYSDMLASFYLAFKGKNRFLLWLHIVSVAQCTSVR